MPRGVTPTATRAVVAERRRQAIELRHAGVDAVTIGQRLRYGKWDGEEQISSDKSIARMVRQDITRGLNDRREGLDTAALAMKLDMTDRLERLRAGLWSAATKGNVGAVREARGLDAQIAHLWGLNAPIRAQIEAVVATQQVEAAVIELMTLVQTPAEDAPPTLALEA